MRNRHNHFITVAAAILLIASSSLAQSTEFTYQGSLTSSGTAANGNFDLEFLLYDAISGGTQIGPILARSGVAVSNGSFVVNLDFGSQFPGASRFLEIRLRPSGQAGMTILSPRQRIVSQPYAIKALSADSATNANTASNAANANNAVTAGNALQLGGIAANQYVLTGDARLSDARNPLPGSPNYVQNTNSLQPASSFNISGTGTAGIINAVTQFNIAGSRFLSNAGSRNVFLGIGAGSSTPSPFATDNSYIGYQSGIVNTTGSANTFVGSSAGEANTDGGENAFFGTQAGQANTSGDQNSFFGRSAGKLNTSGSNNSFFGTTAGDANTTGSNNSFFGSASGGSNTTGIQNSMFGRFAGQLNQTGNNNSFFGFEAGKATTASGNSFFGTQAGLANTSGTSNTFIGLSSGSENSSGDDNVFIGANTGRGNTTGSRNTIGWENTFFGVESGYSTTGQYNTFLGGEAGRANTEGSNNTFVGKNAGSGNTTGSNNTLVGASTVVDSASLDYATAIGAGARVFTSNSIVLGRDAGQDEVRIYGKLKWVTSGSPTSSNVCRDANFYLTFCSSSIRYKTNIVEYPLGLDLVRRLRPVTFDWIESGIADLGFVAEEVAAAEPLLATRNAKGEIEGVKYDQMSAVLVNAIKQQQAMIERQAESIQEQRVQIEALKRANGDQKVQADLRAAELDALRRYICQKDREAPFCKP
jgi:hypothetical protein